MPLTGNPLLVWETKSLYSSVTTSVLRQNEQRRQTRYGRNRICARTREQEQKSGLFLARMDLFTQELFFKKIQDNRQLVSDQVMAISNDFQGEGLPLPFPLDFHPEHTSLYPGKSNKISLGHFSLSAYFFVISATMLPIAVGQ